MTDIKITEIEKDIEEVKSLLQQANRFTNKQLLNTHLEKLQIDLSRLNGLKQAQLQQQQHQEQQQQQQQRGYIKAIDSYGWDQSEKFVKIYITSLKDLNKLDANDVKCHFDEKSFELFIRNLNNVYYVLRIKNLLNKIVPNESTFKVKSDMIVISLRKQATETWADLTVKESKNEKEKATPDFDPNADPQDSLMKMMKKMYDEGDDEMKRTISKAFVESREKQMTGTEGL